MLHQLTSYFSFLKRASNAHGVHSPFVFDLITKCFYDKKKYPEYDILSEHRNYFKNNNDTIEVTDFGQGSRVFKSNTRTISAIAKNAGISKKRQQLLFRIARYFTINNALELGTSLGLGSVAIAASSKKMKLTTVEGCSATSGVAQIGFNTFDFQNIQLTTLSFDRFFSEEIKDIYSLIYIDGNHNKERTLDYFEQLLPYTNEESLLLFDDIYWSKEMTEAWQQIILHEKVTVSIDTFQWGMVFFKKGQVKEHFSIRV